MKYIFSGGGTAGHIMPALAIAEYIRDTEKDSEILFIGREGGAENKPISDAGFDIRNVNITSIERKISLKNIKAILKTLRSLKEARNIIKEFSPDAIIGTGGYVCLPAIYAGQRLGVATFIHESNSTLGLAARLLAKKCRKLFLNTEQTKGVTKKMNCKVIGNPMRKGFCSISKSEARRCLSLKEEDILIVSFGGSLGAEKLNDAVLVLMKELSSTEPRIRHIHATGKRYFKNYASAFEKYKTNGCEAREYIDEMPILLRAADIVISRSGAMSLSEIALVGVAAILIPSPNVTNNHQYENARVFAKAGAAVLIEEKSLPDGALTEAVRRLYLSKKEREKLSKSILKFAKHDSAKAAVREIRRSLSQNEK